MNHTTSELLIGVQLEFEWRCSGEGIGQSFMNIVDRYAIGQLTNYSIKVMEISSVVYKLTNHN